MLLLAKINNPFLCWSDQSKQITLIYENMQSLKQEKDIRKGRRIGQKGRGEGEDD